MSFNDIKGQEKPINLLKGFMEQSRFNAGFLFTGPEGVGKKITAKTLAKALNCLQSSVDSCDRCASCVKIDKGEHPDMHFIETGDSDIKIEYIRQLKQDISLRPYEARMKVFIIDNAHRLTPEAANCLLKILEEPPKNSSIVLISDNCAAIFKTIISRCRVIKFLPLTREDLDGILREDYGIDQGFSHFLAYFCEGRLGYSLRLKDTDTFSFKNRIIDNFALSETLKELPVTDKDEIPNVLNILASWVRDLYYLKIGAPQSEIINFDRRKELLEAAVRYDLSDLSRVLDSISDSMLYLQQNINIKLLLHNLRSELWKN